MKIRKEDKKSIFGIFTPDPEINLKRIQKSLDIHIPIILIFSPWKAEWKKEMAPFPLKKCKIIQKNKSIPFIKWEPATWMRPQKLKNQRKTKIFNRMINDFSLKDIAKGKYDLYIEKWTKQAKNIKKEIWLSFGHEMNGFWYHWAKKPALFKKALLHIYRIFKKLKVKNVRWAFCVNNYPIDYLKYMPKEMKKDKRMIIAIDGYNAEGVWSLTWRPFDHIFEKPYKYILKHFPKNKIIIGEMGCAEEGGNKAMWIDESFQTIRKKYKKLSAIIWFNINKEADWRINSSKETVESIKNSI